MHDRAINEVHSYHDARTRRFRSWSFFGTLLLAGILPVSLFFLQSSLKAIFDDFELDLPRVTLLFLNRGAVYLAFLLPKSVILKELLVHNSTLRHRCDAAIAVVSLIALFVGAYALGSPLLELINGLQG